MYLHDGADEVNSVEVFQPQLRGRHILSGCVRLEL